MRKSHFNDEFLVLLGPIISRLFTCSNEEKKILKRVLAVVLSLWFKMAFMMNTLAWINSCKIILEK
jgi:hypothetical protein